MKTIMEQINDILILSKDLEKQCEELRNTSFAILPDLFEEKNNKELENENI